MIASPTLRAVSVSLLLAGGCQSTDAPTAPPPPTRPTNHHAKCQTLEDRTTICDPSLDELIIRPEWYDGATVVVTGVLDPQREFALFSSEDTYRMYVSRSAVLLSLTPELAVRDFQAFSGEWVFVRGKYVAHRAGSSDRYGGVIVRVELVAPYKSSRVGSAAPPK